MTFVMIDRIVRYRKGEHLEAVKVLSPREEYLEDHFPGFPIMPGVLMLEALAQAGAWLARLSEGFSPPVFLIQEAHAVRYGNVVKPGQELRVSVDLKKREGALFMFKGMGMVADRNAVTGRFVLKRQALSELNPALTGLDERITRCFEEQLSLLMDCST